MLGRLVPIVTTVRPTEWCIVFQRWSTYRVVRWFNGEFKHVACFGHVGGCDSWVFFNPGWDSFDLTVVPDAVADHFIAEIIRDGLVVRFVAPVVMPKRRFQPFMSCTFAVARLTGVRSCALRPDAFLRDCLAQGATVIGGADEGSVRQQDANGRAGGRADHPDCSVAGSAG